MNLEKRRFVGVLSPCGPRQVRVEAVMRYICAFTPRDKLCCFYHFYGLNFHFLPSEILQEKGWGKQRCLSSDREGEGGVSSR